MQDYKTIMENIEKKYNFPRLRVVELINSLNYVIGNPSTYTILKIVSLNRNILIDESQDKLEKRYSIYDGFVWYISRKLIPQGTSVYEFLDNPENAKKDNGWINDRNKNYSYTECLKYNHTPALQQKITNLLIQIRADMTAYQSLEIKQNAIEKVETEQAKKEFDVKILKISTISGGEGGPGPYAKIKITDNESKEEAIFNCRNIFDFGYVINPVDGGTANIDEDTIAVNYDTTEDEAKRLEHFFGKRPRPTGWGWKSNFEGDDWTPKGDNWTPMTGFEIRAINYLNRFSPIQTDMRR